MTIAELRIMCKHLKRKDVGPMPNKKDELLAKYAEWYGRPEPEFIYDTLDVETLTLEEH